MSVVVRLERLGDRPAALEVERRAFGSDEEVEIVEAVRDAEGSFALVAAGDEEVVGHVQLSRAHSATFRSSPSARSASSPNGRGRASGRRSSGRRSRRHGGAGSPR